MKWRLYTVGKPALGYAKLAAEEYLKRLRRYTPCEHRVMRRGDDAEIQGLLDTPNSGIINIILDERGSAQTTEAFAEKVRRWQLESVKVVQCFVGGADGHTPSIRASGDQIWQLSAFTLQHEMALALFLEQLYRVHTILRGEPYHR